MTVIVQGRTTRDERLTRRWNVTRSRDATRWWDLRRTGTAAIPARVTSLARRVDRGQGPVPGGSYGDRSHSRSTRP
jgi:hypothetical protein